MRPAELGAAVVALADRLTAAGLPATTDPRNINPPCAWVTLGAATFPTLCGDLDATASVLLIVPDNGMPTAMHQLGELLDRFTAAEVDLPTGDVLPDTVTIPGAGAGPLPALRLTIPIGA
ncbi:tail terminator [Gordonia phage Schiebs]|nr:tail terminator [Gordonia phage Schiebs]